MRYAVHGSLILLAIAPALACSCMGPRPACSIYFETPLVFYGKVVGKKHIPGPATPPGITAIGGGRYEVRFAVLEAMKGFAESEVVVSTNDASSMCGIDFAMDASYVVYASDSTRTAPLRETGICSGTHRVDDPLRDGDLQWFHSLQGLLGIPVKLNAHSERKPNGIPG